MAFWIGDTMKQPLEPGTKVYLIAGMKKKLLRINNSRTAYELDGRWYWRDGTAVDGSAMRFEEVKK